MINNDMQMGMFSNKHYNFLVLDDEEDVRNDFISLLKSEFPSATITGLASVKECDEYFKNAREVPDLLLLDLMLPDGKGESILTVLRGNELYESMGIIVITAKQGTLREAMHIYQGADDYWRKPVSDVVAIARLKQVLENRERIKSSKSEDESSLVKQYGDFVVDGSRVQAFYQGKSVNLTNREFRLLQFLAENENVVFSRAALLEKVWGYDYAGDERTVDVTVARTRNKIAHVTGLPDRSCIATRRGAGYYFRNTFSD